MKKFIDEIVELYLKDDSSNALTSCIITPNKRAHRFIKLAIINSSTHDDFLPGIFSIDDFIVQNIPLVRIDEVDLSYILYDVFRKQGKQKDLDFDEFLGYSSILLHDFNEIDMQLAEGKSIFTYLNDVKAIQQWNPDGSPLSASQKEYLRFYNHLATIYEEFRKTLLEMGLCYQGMAYRYFAENIDIIIDGLPWERIIFAGFNALTKSEEKIIKALSKKDLVQTIWDADSYYLDNEMMEAGMYLRKYETWNSDIKKQARNHLSSSNKTIKITGVPGVLGQARLASQIIQDKTNNGKHSISNKEKPRPSDFENNTVIVPADENLLLPLLNSLPTRILKNTNITMGFSVQHSHAYRLAESIIHLHLHSSKISTFNTKTSRYHKDDILSVLNNELIAILNGGLIIESKNIIQTFVGQEYLYEIISKQELNSIENAFESCQDHPASLIRKLRLVFKKILSVKTAEENSFIKPEEEDALYQILQVFNRLQILISENQKPETLQGFYTLYKQLVSGLSQSFIGNTHQGLQLMGLLETRLMDFENVIILSSNEDILPASSFSNSFIPSDIRYEFNLPGIQERTAVFAYHFYRLIQRAKNVYLIYSTTKKKMSGGEKSRFIKQIEFELKEYNKEIKIEHHLLNFEKLNISQNNTIEVLKNAFILKKLDLLAEKGLSPTGLISYTRCSLQFYFKYIEKIYEPETAEDVADERIIGNVIHKILEDFYRPYIKQNFPFEKLKAFKESLPKLIVDTFKKEFKGKIDEGQNYLSLKDTEHYLSKFIDNEIISAKKDPSTLIILGVEKDLERIIVIGEDSQKKSIKIRGNADRIDEKNNTIRILDYKTGKVDKKDVVIPKDTGDDLNALFTNTKYDKALQLYIYHWLFRGKSTAIAQTGIVSFRLIKSPYIMLKQEIDEEIDHDFKKFISSIFNADIPFTQTNDTKICSYCAYKNICSK